jgi:phosphoglucosamine mutase
MNHRPYFGTDAIRGRVGEEPITAEFALRLGRAAGTVVRRSGARLVDGEASGHVVCRHKANGGDGLMTALLLLEVIADSDNTLSELVSHLHRFPQKTINARVARNARGLVQNEYVQVARAAVERALGASERMVLRAPGTEPLIRVTGEARESAMVASQAGLLAEAVRHAAALDAATESV